MTGRQIIFECGWSEAGNEQAFGIFYLIILFDIWVRITWCKTQAFNNQIEIMTLIS